MSTRAFIGGVGITEATSPRKQTSSAVELIQQAVWAAIEHAGITPAALDGLVIGDIDGFEGTVLGAKHIVRQLGLGADLPVSVVNTGGTTGGNLMQVAARQVRSGDRQRVLCIGGPTFYGAVDLQSAINTNSPMIVEQPLGMGAYHMGAFYPSAYQRRFGATVEDFAASAVQDHDHASRNPYAHLRNTLTVEDVVNSRPLSSPMTMAMVCPVSTSANALLICSEAAAAEVRPTPVLIGAMATSSDPYLGGGKSDFAAMENLSILARKVYRLADVYDPVSEFDVVEVFSPYAPMQPMQLEALGFAPPGGGIDLIRSGATRIDGKIPVNLSGGPLCTNAGVAGELAPYVYVALQLMGDAPSDIQVPGARRGLAHGTGGTFFQFENLAVLERHERS
ncbi:thiolase family protein [Gordonia westfalica]|uniref:Acetyl-CoA C-acetyltransferase n=1 Tax=Gordonia westfalica TaxID=158898 RepID=A0A1H2LFR6_9ACTN|nr:thiolase family protein [Gordonia westfalica]SDU79246.1 acetyl-CoA C-acetyltransferase [Gordonia westfalica]